MRAAYEQKQGAVQERHRKAAEVAQLVATGRTTVPNPSILPNPTITAANMIVLRRKCLHEMEAVWRARLEDAFIKHDPPLAVQLDYLGASILLPHMQ